MCWCLEFQIFSDWLCSAYLFVVSPCFEYYCQSLHPCYFYWYPWKAASSKACCPFLQSPCSYYLDMIAVLFIFSTLYLFRLQLSGLLSRAISNLVVVHHWILLHLINWPLYHILKIMLCPWYSIVHVTIAFHIIIFLNLSSIYFKSNS